MGRMALCRLEELVEGQARGFDPKGKGEDTLFALRYRGQLRVYRNLCPHLRGPLEYRKDRFLSADGQWVVCYAHGARFRPDDGTCVHGPCRGEALHVLQHHEAGGWLLVPLEQLGH
ncbi:Rieske (2Fe-2S) protein [Pseudomonas taiwanensis]|uniref:Rieske 2Fe-2S domain-containing protein n=1 Tax=Pseudomonas taiwanensis TaxID=470150 RepID=A0ABR6V3N1_9PSED|nr:Rieske 2Fe-2S domain-containing protein [Pseudomonas taiwanensis]MBC3475029.1 Rieske 2Fe-2S domain-containing protein [Pseudomonas taiwanensis]MBC3490359.1 Rieske 2Fe-2S domain-containing protein [Pseudomonas taiwanensis]